MSNRKGNQSVSRGRRGSTFSFHSAAFQGLALGSDWTTFPFRWVPLAAALRAGCGDGGKCSGRETSEETAALRQVPGGGGWTRGEQGVTLQTWHQLPRSVCPDSVTA